MGNFFGALCVSLSVFISPVSLAARWDNPQKTDEQDLVIDLPVSGADERAVIVMRRMNLPGSAFWLDTNRFIELGEGGSAGIYERPVSVDIKGVTRSGDQWHIWLGKYETTIGQFAAVMGKGDLAKGLAVYAEYSGRGEDYLKPLLASEEKRNLALAKPVDRLAPVYIQLFLRELNTLCLSNETCRNSLPSVGADSTISGEKYIPFFRLPTEIEWEYAARGVSVDRGKYRNRLPVSASKIGNYAQLEKVSSIGRKKSIFGFYDMFGNTSELVSGRMSEEIGGNHAGAWLAKGGKASATSKKPYTSQREEVLEFEWLSEDAAPRVGFFNKVGFRLAIGAPLQAFDKLASSERPESSVSPASTSDTSAIASSTPPIDDLESVVEQLRKAGSADENSLRVMNSALERLRSDNAKRDIRSAKFIVDNIHSKIVRVWSLQYSGVQLTKKQRVLLKDSERNKSSIQKITDQIEYGITQSKTLVQDYEEGLSALVDIPSIDETVIDSIDLDGYKQGSVQITMAVDAKKLISRHIKNKKLKKPLNITREIDNGYPF